MKSIIYFMKPYQRIHLFYIEVAVSLGGMIMADIGISINSLSYKESA
ncbi:hypothetical protein [Zobellia uliginosa]|nr:hypothetical protein [Zobellia uliginosa]MDO6519471.1 hypothetical protein [Zobellia uliginosa]